MIHGVGQQHYGWSFSARRRLRAALKLRGRDLWAVEALWVPLADRYETAMLSDAERDGSDGNAAQRLITGTVADALLYDNNPEFRAEVFALLDARFAELRRPPVVFAHSLGCLIVSDYLRSRPAARIAALHSFGDNLGLFWMGRTFDCPAQLAVKGVWRDYWTPSDALGYPLKSRPGFEHVTSTRVSVGNWFDRWSGLSHAAWWDSAKLWSETIPAYL